MAITNADYDVLTDRVEALEEVIRLLLRHMAARSVIPADLPEGLVDSLIDVATGNPRAEAQAHRWEELIEGRSRL